MIAMLEEVAKALTGLAAEGETTVTRDEWEEGIRDYVLPILDSELVSYEVQQDASSVTIKILH